MQIAKEEYSKEISWQILIVFDEYINKYNANFIKYTQRELFKLSKT
jgi:hypothetical protein